MSKPKGPEDGSRFPGKCIIQQHSKDLTDHNGRLAVLEKKLGSSEQIVLLLESASDSKGFDKILASTFASILRNPKANPDIRNAVVDLIDKNDRAVVFSAMKKCGAIIAKVLWCAASTVLSAWFGHTWPPQK